MSKYCQSKCGLYDSEGRFREARLTQNNAYGWVCTDNTGIDYPINAFDACTVQHGLAWDGAAYTNYNDPYSWYCTNSRYTTTVTSIAPLNAVLGQKTTFTVNGVNLPSSLVLWLADCINPLPVPNGTSTQRQFTCTPSYTVGTKPGEVKDKPGTDTLGILLSNFKVNVSLVADNAPTFSGVGLPSSVTLPNKIYFSGTANDDKGLSIITVKVSGPKGNNLTVLTENVSGTSRSLGGYYFDSSNSTYAGIVGTYTVTLWVKDNTNQTANISFIVAVTNATKVLSSLGSDCPSNTVTEGGSINCQARAYYTDGTSEDVTSRATWSENSNYASIDVSGKLTTTDVTSDQTVTVTASFTSGGVTKSPYAFVTIKDSYNLIAPSNLRVSFSGINYTIAWNDNSNNEDGFKLEGSTDQVSWRELFTYPANTTSVSGSTTGVTPGTKVYYRIRAYLGSIYSPYSNVLEFVIPATSVQFDNKWRAGQMLTVNGNNKWVTVNVSGTSAVNICEAASPSKCLNIETGTLQSSIIQSGWLSAQWTLETVDSNYVRIKNLWKTDHYIHWEDSTPVAGQIQMGWWSAQWKVY